WEVLHRLAMYIEANLHPRCAGEVQPGAFVSDRVYVAPGAVIEAGAMVKGPAIIGPGTVVRHGAYVREYVLVGARCVIGHATEVKHSILLDGACAPHFNYVRDSILGCRVNLGAGAKLSNVKDDGREVVVHLGETSIPT